MGYVLIDEQQFGDLLASRAALMGVSYYVSMGESVLLEGVGEIYMNPVAVAVGGAFQADDLDDDMAHEAGACDCE